MEMKAQLKITSVEEVKGFIYDNDIERYSASGNPRKANPKSLKINGVLDGVGEVCFFTPTAILLTSLGVNTEITTVYQTNNWFIETDSEVNLSNESMGLPKYGQVKNNLIPSVKNGDIVNISFSVKGMYGNKTGLNRVKLIN